MVIDTSIWVDYFRSKTPNHVKHLADRLINSPGVWMCEPIHFELLRSTPVEMHSELESYFSTFPVLPTPGDLWLKATYLGQKCQEIGFNPRPLDILIAQICLTHNTVLATFDADFNKIASVCNLQVNYFDRLSLP